MTNSARRMTCSSFLAGVARLATFSGAEKCARREVNSSAKIFDGVRPKQPNSSISHAGTVMWLMTLIFNTLSKEAFRKSMMPTHQLTSILLEIK